MARTRRRRLPSFARTAGSRGDCLRSPTSDLVEVVVVVDVVVDVDVDVDVDLVRQLQTARPMNYRNLDVYQLAVRFLPIAAETASGLPRKYSALADQIRRASLSISLNIAEGSGKTTGPDQRRFYAMARGSAMECGAVIDACIALSLMREDRAKDANEILESVVRMLSKMCRE